MPLIIRDVISEAVRDKVAPPGKGIMEILGGNGEWTVYYKHSNATKAFSALSGDDVPYWWTYLDFGLKDGNPRKTLLGLLDVLGIEKKVNALGLGIHIGQLIAGPTSPANKWKMAQVFVSTIKKHYRSLPHRHFILLERVAVACQPPHHHLQCFFFSSSSAVATAALVVLTYVPTLKH